MNCISTPFVSLISTRWFNMLTFWVTSAVLGVTELNVSSLCRQLSEILRKFMFGHRHWSVMNIVWLFNPFGHDIMYSGRVLVHNLTIHIQS